MFKDGCKGCDLSQGRGNPRGGVVVELDGKWLLNHYGGEEGFLGWLALQTEEHITEIEDIPWKDLDKLGGHIRRIDEALRDYWRMSFPNDPIERVYVVYFFESVFDEPPTQWHLHIHLIPRTKQVGRGNPSRVAAWHTPCLVRWKGFPQEYRLRDESRKEHVNEEQVVSLMKYLKSRLGRQQAAIQ